MYKKEKQRGITLIALVITIIVMLILVGVTISIAINGGLFEQAGKAASKTNEALKAEEELSNGKIQIGDDVYNSIEEYVNKYKGGNEETLASKITAANYGDYIDYKVDLDGDTTNAIDWQVFYNDGTNVFIIASHQSYLEEIDYPYWGQFDEDGTYQEVNTEYQEVNTEVATKFKAEFGDYSTYESGRRVSTLLNTNNWTTYAAGLDGAIAIGSPTLEMFIASYNAKSATMPDAGYGTWGTYSLTKQEYGYELTRTAKNELTEDHGEGYGECHIMYFPDWLDVDGTCFPGYKFSSPGDAENVWYWMGNFGEILIDSECSDPSGLRPVVCLPAGTTAVQNEAGTWINLE